MKKLKVIQFGINHEHSLQKYTTCTKFLRDTFELIGVVDDTYLDSPSRPIDRECYKDANFITPEEAFNCKDLDAVLVEVPNLKLVEIGMEFAKRKIPMHLEKIAGETVEPYRQLLQVCKENRIPLQMGYMYRGNPALKFLKQMIKDKVIGEIFQADLDMNLGYGGDDYQKYIGKFKGGIMWNLGCHLIDFILAAMGAPDEVISIMKSAPGDPDSIKNNCTALLEYPHASVAIRACSRSINDVKHRRWYFAGTNGMVEVTPPERFDGESVELRINLKNETASFPAGEQTIKFEPQQDRHEEQLREFSRIVRGEIENPYTYEHDLAVHKLTLAAAGYIKW